MTEAAFASNLHTDGSADLVLEADVLVVGGSLAGCWTALAARAAGAKVVLVEKGWTGTAGVVAAANVGGYSVAPDAASAERRRIVEARHDAAEGLDDLVHVERVYAEAHRAYAALEALGFRWDARANAGARFGRFIGPYTLHVLRGALERAGVRLLDHAPALELLAHDGAVAGAAGIERKTGRTWAVRAGAVVLATGATAFLSGAMGTHGVVGDGYLLAGEAGATFSGLEFSTLYGFAPKGSPSTKGWWTNSASWFDAAGRPLGAASGRGGMAEIARAVLETGGIQAIIDRGPDGFEAFSRLNHPNTFQYFDRLGIDPFRQRFAVEMIYEGHIRAVGGVVVDDACSTGIAGLYAAGDLTDRSRLTGAAMCGAGPAVAWCFASGEWAGRAAAQHARTRTDRPARLEALGRVGLRFGTGGRNRPDEVRTAVRSEILPLEKTCFKTTASLERSRTTLDSLWDRSAAGFRTQTADDVLKAREAAALVAAARLQTVASLVRKESRGLHRLEDHPVSEGRMARPVLLSGLDTIASDWSREPRMAVQNFGTPSNAPHP